MISLLPLLLVGAGSTEPFLGFGPGIVRHLYETLQFEYVILISASRSTRTDILRDEEFIRTCKALSEVGIYSMVVYITLVDYKFSPLWTGRYINLKPGSALIIAHSHLNGTQELLEKWWKKMNLGFKLCDKNHWLLFLDDNLVMSRYLSLVHVPFQTTFLVVRRRFDVQLLTLVYRAGRDNGLEERCIGTWKETSNVTWMKTDILKRGNDLQGVTITAITRHNPPYTKLHSSTEGLHVTGYIGAVWRLLQKQLNFTTLYDTSYPQDAADHDMFMTIRYMESTELVGVSDMPLTSRAYTHITFSSPLMHARYLVFMQDPGSTTPWSWILSPFDYSLWIVTAVVVIFTTGCLFVINLHLRVSINDTVWAVFSAFCMQGTLVMSAFDSRRILDLTLNLTAVVLMAGYSATLISFLAAQKSQLPFMSIEDLEQDGGYKIGAIDMSSELELLIESNDNTMASLSNNIKSHILQFGNSTFSKTLMGNLQLVCTSKYVLFTRLDSVLASNLTKLCDLVTLPRFSLSLNIAMPFAKGNQYRRIINRNINKLREGGILQRLLDRERPRSLKKQIRKLTKFNLVAMTPLLLVLGTGISVSLLVLGIECSCNYYRK